MGIARYPRRGTLLAGHHSPFTIYYLLFTVIMRPILAAIVLTILALIAHAAVPGNETRGEGLGVRGKAELFFVLVPSP